MIFIDFQGGAHGNYLEFVCNHFLAKISLTTETPFTKSGSSHSKIYKDPKLFNCGHYSYGYPPNSFKNSKIISIKIEYNDLLPLSCISFLRAGDYNYDVDNLENDTYNKLDNFNYSKVLEVLKEKYFSNQDLIRSYNNIKDSTWPEISSYDDFLKLPAWIQTECVEIHQMQHYRFDRIHSDCPRHILREFFKLGFKNPDLHGFIHAQKMVTYDQSNDVFVFPFSAFYNQQLFMDYIDKIGSWSGLSIDSPSQIKNLHTKFLKKQPYKDIKITCDNVLNKIKAGEVIDLSGLNLMCESYINAQLELLYNIEIPFYMPTWFTNTKEIYKLL